MFGLESLLLGGHDGVGDYWVYCLLFGSSFWFRVKCLVFGWSCLALGVGCLVVDAGRSCCCFVSDFCGLMCGLGVCCFRVELLFAGPGC